MKRLLAFVMAVVMVLGMTVVVNAETPEAHTYDAYQVFAGTVDDGKISNATVGDGIDFENFLAALQADKMFGTGSANAFYGLTTATEVAKAIGALDTAGKQNRAAVIAGKNVTGTGVEVTAGAETDLGDAGYYVLVDKTEGVANDSPILFLTDADGKITASTKVDLPTITKTIKDGDAYKDSIVAKLNDVITFKIEATLPNNYSDYATYKVVIKDTLPKGLKFKKIVSGYIDDIELESSDYTLVKTQNPFTITIDDVRVFNQTDAKKIVFEYTATFEGSDDADENGYINSVEMTYPSNPIGDGEDTTVPGIATVYQLEEITLPSTGGVGTVLFYALGAMLICGGAAMMMLRKRVK